MKNYLFLALLPLITIAFPTQMMSQISLKEYKDVCVLEYSISSTDFREGIACVKKNGKWGYIDKQGNEIIPFIFDNASSFSEGIACVKKDGKWGYIDKQGHEIIPFIYENGHDFREGIACVKKDGKWGYIDKQGHEITPFIYKEGSDFSEGMALVNVVNVKVITSFILGIDDVSLEQYGYIDKQGREIIPCKFTEAYSFSEGMACVNNVLGWYYIDKQGNEIIPSVFEDASSFSEGMALVEKDGKCGYIDKQGREIIPFIYENGYDFREGIALVNKNGKWGHIDKQGHEITPFIFDNASSFSEGMASVKSNGKWGFIDKQGREIIPFIYENGYDFREGIACVKKNGKWGHIDKQGHEITPFIFDNASSFSEGMARVEINETIGFINKNGEPITINFSGKTCYENGVYEENRISQNDSEEVKYNKYKKALSWFMKGAEKNNPECCFKVGYYKYSGLFVEKNYAEAVKWLETSNQLYEKSNELKDTNGNTFRFLGYCYSEGGYGIIKDDSKAFSYFMEGAKYNNEGCFYALAISYLNGLGCDIDNEQACHYADELYNINKEDYSSIYGKCYNGLAYYYANKKDFSKALSSIEKAIDANPMVGNLYDSKGEIFLMMGKEDEALKLWNKVMELDKDNLKFYEENSELYKQLKAKGKITSSSSSSSSTNKPTTSSTSESPSWIKRHSQ